MQSLEWLSNLHFSMDVIANLLTLLDHAILEWLNNLPFSMDVIAHFTRSCNRLNGLTIFSFRWMSLLIYSLSSIMQSLEWLNTLHFSIDVIANLLTLLAHAIA